MLFSAILAEDLVDLLFQRLFGRLLHGVLALGLAVAVKVGGRIFAAVESLVEVPQKEVVIERNHRIITKKYNRQIYQKTLMQIYNRVIREPVRQRIDKKVLLTRFFDLNTFSLLKWATSSYCMPALSWTGATNSANASFQNISVPLAS